MQLLGLSPAAPDADGYAIGGAEIEARTLDALFRAAANDEAANVRIHAVEALGSWGELPPEAAPALLEFIRRDEGHWIALALGVLPSCGPCRPTWCRRASPCSCAGAISPTPQPTF